MRQQRDADAERLDLRGPLIDARSDTALFEVQRERQPADSAANDGYLHAARMDEIGKSLSTRARQEGRPAMDKTIYDRGMAMRRKVLGDDYVDRTLANATDFDRQFQEHLTEYAWGAVWGDDALKPRDRSLLNLGMIAALGRMHEFEIHFRGATHNGLSHRELAAILRQIAVYCGFPAAVDAHRVAKRVLAEDATKT
jgi:4-carboxymuconolactone decarboxylase